jgi:virulence factor Mce-like protein
VSARLLPKTLFGERYEALQIPQDPGPPIKSGDVIQQDRTQASLELQQALSDLLTVIQSVKPAELNATLTALAQALQGRGVELGHNLASLDDYLRQLNPYVPQMVTDITKLGQVATEYTGVLPDLLDTLTNLQTTAATLTQKQAALDSLLHAATDGANVLDGFLSDNADRIVSVSASSNRILGLFAAYSPEFPCMEKGLAQQEQTLEQVFHNNRLNITLQTIKQRGKYVPGNEPVLVTGIGPNCYGLPNTPRPFQPPDINDGAGVRGDPSTGAQPDVDKSGLDQEGLGTLGDVAVINSLIAPTLGTSGPQVPAIATVLSAPLLRGNTVEVSS